MELPLYGGTFKSTEGGSNSVLNCGDLTINGGVMNILILLMC